MHGLDAPKGVSKESFGGTRAVEPTDLTFPKGELTALLGPSGCGKTTLLRMIAGLEPPTRGYHPPGREDITAAPAHKRKFGMVFQNFALFPALLRPIENVAYSLTFRWHQPRRTPFADKAEKLLETGATERFRGPSHR